MEITIFIGGFVTGLIAGFIDERALGPCFWLSSAAYLFGIYIGMSIGVA
jgi:hypothetical protein